MAKDNAFEFTELKYTSRKEMSNELGIVVPDDMWKKVADYRAKFSQTLPLKDINSRSLSLCLFETLKAKIKQIEGKVRKLVSDNNSLEEITGDKQHFHLTLQANCLKVFADNSKIEIETPRIKKLITSENPYDQDEEKMLNYLSALEYVESNRSVAIDIDYLAEVYSKVTGITELTYFYRDSDINDVNSIAMVGRSYTKAPSRLIDTMMEMLFQFIGNCALDAVSKSLVTYYYVQYVWPFRDFNNEIAYLLAKSVLVHYSELEELGAYVPFERFVNEKENIVNRIFSEVRNTADVTYFVSPFSQNFDRAIDEMLEILKDYSSSTANELKHDFYQEDKPEIEEKEEQKADEPVEETKEPVSEVKEEKVEEKPVSSTVVEVKEEKKEKPVVKNEVPPTDTSKIELAVTYIPRELDEKEAKRLEQHLLELDVRLKKGEAYFYARHCTIGMYYTIEQYRKALKCVYETARTSMDHLAELGYYEKTKYGKKFVYTPVKRK